MADARRWTHVAERGSLLGLRITVTCYRLFGRSLSLILVHCIVTYFFLTGKAARAATRAYQRRVVEMFGTGTQLGVDPGMWQCFQQFRAFALAIFDRIVMWFGDEADFRYDVVGTEHYDRLLRPRRDRDWCTHRQLRRAARIVAARWPHGERADVHAQCSAHQFILPAAFAG